MSTSSRMVVEGKWDNGLPNFFPGRETAWFEEWTTVQKTSTVTLKLGWSILNWESQQKQLDQQPQVFQVRGPHVLWPKIFLSAAICNGWAKDLTLEQFKIQWYLSQDIWVISQLWHITSRCLQNIFGSTFWQAVKEQGWYFVDSATPGFSFMGKAECHPHQERTMQWVHVTLGVQTSSNVLNCVFALSP